MNDINLLITFVHRRYAVVFLRSLPSQTMRIMRACSRAYYDIFYPLSALINKRRRFILAHNIRPNVRHSFGEPAQTFGFGRMS